MKRIGLVFAAAAALTLATAPTMIALAAAAAPAKPKTLWQGWLDDVKKLQEDIAGKSKAKK